MRHLFTMKFTLLLSIFFLSILCFDSSVAFGKRFHRKGYEIEVLFKQKGKTFKVWGKMSGGKYSCEQMNLRIYFDNLVSGQRTHVSAVINQYTPQGRNNYKAVTKISKQHKKEFHQKSSRYKWFVYKYYFKCLN